MSKKKNSDWMIVVGVALLVLIGSGYIQLPTLAIGENPQAPAGGAASPSGGGGPSGGEPAAPPTNDSGDGGFIFFPINFCDMYPWICSNPPADDPYAPTPDLTPETGGAMTLDPCIANPNAIGCGETDIPEDDGAMLPAYNPDWFCQGVNYGQPYYQGAWYERSYSYDCTGNRDCWDNPPVSYIGRDTGPLVCCNSECWDTVG